MVEARAHISMRRATPSSLLSSQSRMRLAHEVAALNRGAVDGVRIVSQQIMQPCQCVGDRKSVTTKP